MKKMILHLPFQINYHNHSASQIRPQKMMQAFQAIGYEVELIMGDCKARKKQIAKTKTSIENGTKYDFIYSESSTQPNFWTGRGFNKCVLLDYSFFKFCKSYDLKIGLFYRDIYWLFNSVENNSSFLKKKLMRFFYEYDLKQYNKLVNIVYLPSMQMAKYIPTITQDKFKALPPGHDEYEKTSIKKSTKSIELLYIGGLGCHYQMHKLFTVLKEFPKIHFTLCTRENEWQNKKDEYELPKNIFIVHKNGDELKELYSKADIAMLFVEPQEYREFAAPVKLYEYIGKEKPIIASCGTLAGEFVAGNSIGWTIEYKENALKELFERLLDDIDEINRKKEKIQSVKSLNSWKARAMEVRGDLSV